MPAICPLPPWPTSKRWSQIHSISSELTEELQAEKTLPFSVPSTLRYIISLAMFDIYRLPYITAIIFLLRATCWACWDCKCCVCTALKDPTVIFHNNIFAKSFPFSTCIFRHFSFLHSDTYMTVRGDFQSHPIVWTSHCTTSSNEPAQVSYLSISVLN